MLQGTTIFERRLGAVRITQTRYDDGVTLPQHGHAGPYVSILLEGEYAEVRAGVPQRCTRGTVIVHPGGEEHADHFLRSGRCLNVEIVDPAHAAHDRLAGSCSAGSNAQVHAAAQHLVQLIEQNPRSSGAVAVEAAVDALLAALEPRDEPAAAVRPSWLRAALDEFAWTEAAPLERIAHAVNVHPVHFSRAFRRHVGVTPKEYRRRARVQAASELLLRTRDRLADVAQAAGFHDQSHLTRAFAVAAGMSPARYRHVFRR